MDGWMNRQQPFRSTTKKVYFEQEKTKHRQTELSAERSRKKKRKKRKWPSIESALIREKEERAKCQAYFH